MTKLTYLVGEAPYNVRHPEHGVTLTFYPFRMEPEYSYSPSYLAELEAAEQERRLPRGPMFRYIFRRLVGTDIMDYFIEMSLPVLERNRGGLKYEDPRPESRDALEYSTLSGDFDQMIQNRDSAVSIIAMNKMMAMFFQGQDILSH